MSCYKTSQLRINYYSKIILWKINSIGYLRYCDLKAGIRICSILHENLYSNLFSERMCLVSFSKKFLNFCTTIFISIPLRNIYFNFFLGGRKIANVQMIIQTNCLWLLHCLSLFYWWFPGFIEEPKGTI